MNQHSHSLGQAREPSIVWLGPIVDEATMIGYRAVSPAANRWQYGLLTALQRIGASATTLGHVPEPLWPKGRPWIRGDSARIAPGLKGRLVGYANLPLARQRLLQAQYLRAFRYMCSCLGSPDAIVTYNATPHNARVGLYAQEELGIPWVVVVADGPAVASQLPAHEALVGRASGRVFLSWRNYTDYPSGPSLHLDGGIGQVRFDPTRVAAGQPLGKSIVLYTGSIDHWAGVDLLVEAFLQVPGRAVELWLCGKGTTVAVERAVQSDSRIKVLGMVSEEQLASVSQQATLFVNPRLSAVLGNRSNFPSKVLEYLSYGKPVISTWTEGLSPEYRDILTVPEEETPDGLAQQIIDVLGWPENVRQRKAESILYFLTTRKLWSIQAERFRTWLVALISAATPRTGAGEAYGVSAESQAGA